MVETIKGESRDVISALVRVLTRESKLGSR